MRINSLTPKQQETLEYLKGYIARNDQSPTLTEIRNDLGLRSIRSVTQRIEALEAKGLVKRDRFQHRSIQLIESDPYSPLGTIQVPVVATAGCDSAEVYAEEQFNEYLHVDRSLVRDAKDIVALKASGSSMVDAGIRNGDYVLVEVTENVSNGDRVVAILEDMTVIKKLYRTEDAVILIPESKGSQYSPIIMSGENSKIFGKVVGVIPMNLNNDYEIVYDRDIKF